MLDYSNNTEALIELLENLTEPNPDIDYTFISGLYTHYFPKLNKSFIDDVGDSPILAAIMYKNMAETCDSEAFVEELVLMWHAHPVWHDNATTKECFHEFVQSMNRKKLMTSKAIVSVIEISLLEFTNDISNLACLQEASKTLKELYLYHEDLIDTDVLVKVFSVLRSFLTLNHFATMVLTSPCMDKLKKHPEFPGIILERIRTLDRAEENIAVIGAIFLYHLEHTALFDELKTFACSATVKLTLQKVFELQLHTLSEAASQTYAYLVEFSAPNIDYFLPYIHYMKKGLELQKMILKYTDELRDPKYCTTKVLRNFLMALSNQVPLKFFINLIVILGPRIVLRPNDFFYLELMKKPGMREGIQTVINLHVDTNETDKFHAVLDILNYFEEVVKKPLELVLTNTKGNMKQTKFVENLQKAMEDEYVFLAQDALKVFSRHFTSIFVNTAVTYYEIREDKEFRLIIIKRLRELVSSKNLEARKMAIVIVNKVTDDAPEYDLFVAAQRLASELNPQFITKERRNRLATVIKDMEATKKRAITQSEGKERIDDILRTLSSLDQTHTNCVAKECY